jgi:hypothetical protein
VSSFLFLSLACLCAYIGAKQLKSRMATLRGRVITIGRVVHIPERIERGPKRTSYYYRIIATFDAPDRMVEFTSDEMDKPPYVPGSPIRMHYRPGQPSDCGICTFAMCFAIPVSFLGFALALIILVGGWWTACAAFQALYPLAKPEAQVEASGP